MRPLLLGSLLWAGGTLVIRWQGHRFLRPGADGGTLALYLASFLLFAWASPRLLPAGREARFSAVTLLLLPTLLLDPLACLYFPALFPNVDSAAAGLFGGWMLICCGGAVAGVWLRR